MTPAVRRARPDDLATLVDFTLEEAREAESRDLDPTTVRQAILSTLDRYLVIEEAGAVVGSASTFTEWSDWNNGEYWWLQMVYLRPEARGRGLVQHVVDAVERLARAAGGLELRLYVHKSNQRAHRAYEKLGFEDAPYRVMSRPLRRS